MDMDLDAPWPQCRIQVQDVFGPQVTDCHDNFDFTLLFEESILYLAPLLIALSAALLRLWRLRSAQTALKREGVLFLLKPLCWTTFTLLNLTHLVLSLVLKSSTTRLSTATITIGFAVSPLFAFLSLWEHTRSPRPSTILNVYLLGTLPMDAARARTLFRIPGNHAIAGIFTTIVACKVMLLALEAKEKHSLLFEHRFTPEETAGILNRAFFWWFNPLLLVGYKGTLVVEKLIAVDEDISLQRSKEEIRRRWGLAPKHEPASLVNVLLGVYKWALTAGFLPRLCLIGVNYAQPFLVNRVTSFLGQPDTPETSGIASGLIVAYAIVYMGIAIITAMFHHRSYRMVMMIRGGLILLIYDHTLNLNASSPFKNDSYTLITADVERIVSGLRSFHETWASLIEIALSLWMLQMKIAVSVVAAAMVVLVSLLASGALSALLGVHQNRWLEAMQARLNATLATIGSIKGIKSTGMTNTLYTTILKLRTTEIHRSLKFRGILVGLVTLSYVSTTMAPAFAFGTYSVLAKLRDMTPLIAAPTFSSLTIITLLGQAVAGFVESIMGLIQALASLERIRQYLAREEVAGFSSAEQYRPNSSDGLMLGTPILDNRWTEMRELDSPAVSTPLDISPLDRWQVRYYGPRDLTEEVISIRKHYASWTQASEPVIVDINASISRGSFVMVVGPVGSGKSTLLHSILGEVPHSIGTVAVHEADAAYCAQTAWLTNTNIRNNILGGSHFDLGRYKAVVEACALHRDFAQLPHGDRSMIGSKGVLLSGGQRNRLALARALYADKALVLLDDVFAGLDPKTEQDVFVSLFGPGGMLRLGKTVVLATNSTRNISSADYIMVLGAEGRLVEQGTPAELLESGTSLLSDKLLDSRGSKRSPEPSENRPKSELALRNSVGGPAPADLRRMSDLAIYGLYIKTIGWGSWCIFLFPCVGFVAASSFSQIWLKFWTEANAQKPHDRLAYFLSLYALWSVLAITFFLVACLHLMLKIVPKAARDFHNALLETIMRAPLAFFSKTDSGEISNHFSQDLELIDMELPRALIGTVISLILCIAQMAIVVYSSNYLAVTIPFLIALLYLVQMFYLRTSQQLRILELEARAPLLSHFMETIAGLVSLRAFGWTARYAAQNLAHLKIAQQSAYLLFCAQVWLTLTLDIIVAFLAVILVCIAVTTRGSSAASIGLALVNIIALGANLKGFVYNWTALENAMGAIARVRVFTRDTPWEGGPRAQIGVDVSPEQAEAQSASVPGDWPQRGLIRFTDVTASYDLNSPPVLNNITLTIQPGEKLAICGRTGCGKSSLIATLLHLLEFRTGSVEIDGLDIATIPRETVRRRINTLPQDPFFYHATLRENLTTMAMSGAGSGPGPASSSESGSQTSDEEILDTLSRLGLKDIITRKGGLDMVMAEEGFLSKGQQQLLCLARALLRRRTCSILVLDEVTSCVDPETESLIQQVIDEGFRAHTVLSIAHRLNTIMGFDKVVVLDQGRVVEYGDPRVLAVQDSVFAELLRSSGDEGGRDEDDDGDGDGDRSED
ncbi:putative ABC transporter [Aspergillus californicus]